ncbi:UDP-glucoronosyl and UDP-glucosyl transferase, partial [Musa troglodytarum]
INAFLQLARLSCTTSNGVHFTLLSANINVPQIESLLPASMSISVVSLHLSVVLGLPLGIDSIVDLPPASLAAKLLKLVVHGIGPKVESLLREFRPHLVVFDFGMQWLLEVAEPLRVWTHFFFVFVVISIAPARRLHDPALTLDDIMSSPTGFPP